jgi:hypothetical protein
MRCDHRGFRRTTQWQDEKRFGVHREMIVKQHAKKQMRAEADPSRADDTNLLAGGEF